MAYTSLFKKDDVRVTQTFSSTHKGLDLSRGVVEQPIYLPKKAVEGYVWKILSGYSYGGKYYANSPIIYIKHKDGSGSRYIHSYTKNVKVKVGDTIKAGDQICATGNSGYSFGDHLHFEWLKKWEDIYSHTDPVPLIFNENAMDFKKGDRVQFTAVQNIRSGSGTTFPVTSQSSKGMLATIIGGSRVANGYTWWDIRIDGGGTGWTADVGKFTVYTAPAPTPPPVIEPIDPCKELREALGALEDKLKVAEDRVAYVESVLKNKDEEIGVLEDGLSSAMEEKKRFVKQYLDAVTELNELKASHWTKQLRDEIVALWNKYKDAILKLIKGQ